MDIREIQELLDLRGWNRMRLAVELGLTENGVQQWFGKARRNPSGPACILMRMWLEESRQQQPDRRPKRSGREVRPAHAGAGAP